MKKNHLQIGQLILFHQIRCKAACFERQAILIFIVSLNLIFTLILNLCLIFILIVLLRHLIT